jgi:hypothetical protein
MADPAITSSADYEAAQDFLREHLSPALTGDNWDALLAAIAVGDSYNKENARLAFDQMFRSSASGQYLDRRMADYGVRRPASIGMDDDLFRDLGLILSNDAMTNLALWEILEIYYGTEAVRANLTSTLSEPYSLLDGDTLLVRVDERDTITATLRAADFKNITQATAIEIAAALNRAFQIAGSSAFAVAFLNSTDGKTYVRLFSGALGLVGAIRVLGGHAQNDLQFPDKLTTDSWGPPANPLDPFVRPTDPPIAGGTLPTAWSLVHTPGTNIVRMQFSGGDDPLLDLVRVGDYVNIYGTSFSAQNRGTFTITSIFLDGSTGPRTVWIEFVNVHGVTQTVTVGSPDDVVFYRPTRSVAPTARISTASADAVEITLPATTQAVNRTIGSGAYLHAQDAQAIVSLNRDSTGVATVVTASPHGLAVGDAVFIDGAYAQPNNNSPGWAPLLASMHQHRTQHSVIALNSGHVLVVGGIDENGIALPTVEKYDPATRTWTVMSQMSKARYDHRATLLADGRVLVTGGNGLGTAIWNTAEIFDPATNTWSSAGSMANARTAHVSVLLSNNNVLVLGGCTAASYDIYNPATNTWTNAGLTAAIGAYATGTRLQDGHVLVVGGGAASTAAYLFRPESSDWVTQNSLATGRSKHTATLLTDGRLLVVGGATAIGAALATTEIFNPTSGIWAAGPAMAYARYFHGAAILSSGKVVVLGGFLGPSNVPGTVVESFRTTANSWVVEPALAAARASFGKPALLANDKLVIAGGTNGTTALATGDGYPLESGGGQNGFFTVASVLAIDTFTYLTPGFPYVGNFGAGGTVLPLAAPDEGGVPGPYVFDTTEGLPITSVSTTLQQTISAGQNLGGLKLADASGFPDAEGWLVVGFGTSYEQGPIRYSGRISGTQLLLDLTYIFTADIPTGADVTLLLGKEPWLPDDIESVGAFYVTASPAGRVAASATLDDMVAAGFNVEKTILYPGDRGLGGEGWPATGQKLSDAVSVWAGDDVDGEVAAARGE